MNEQSEQSFSFEEVAGSAWWIHQISVLPNWRHGGVFLLCTGSNSSVAPAGAWFFTAAHLFTEQGEPFFQEIELIVPPGTKQLNYQDRIKDAVRYSFEKSNREIPVEISHRLKAIDWPWIQSDAENILEHLQTLPEGSAISIAGAERLRFPKLEGRSGPLVLTHMGQRVSHSSADDLMLPHLRELLRRLLKVANDRRLSVVVFVENFDFEMGKLTEDLRVNPELAVMSVRYGDTVRSDFRTVIEALKISRTVGLESAIQFICQNISDKARQAHAVSYIYCDQGLWTEAWKSVEDHLAILRASNEAGVILNLAQTAAGCGQAKSADELLHQACALGFETVEAFNAAAILARSIGIADLLDQIIAEMRIAYPHHPMTVACAFGRLIATGRHSEAIEMADAVGAKFEAAWARLHDQQTPDWNAFINVGREFNREQDAIAKCVTHALNIGQSFQARDFFNMIPNTRDTADLRADLLFDIIIKEIGFVRNDTEIESLCVDCSTIFIYLAMNPADTALRNRVSHWFESSADERLRILLLLRALTGAYKKSATLFEPANASNEISPWSFANSEQSSHETSSFMRKVAETSSGRPLGQAIAPDEYSTSVPDEVMHGLGVLVQIFTKKPDLKGIGTALQCLNLACRIRHEPSWDFEAAIQLAGSLASHGKISDGLNLAENILIFWGDGGGEFGAARRAHAWSCIAEVYHRSRNPLISLLHLILCFESMATDPDRQHATLLKQKLRLATRILRDLNCVEFVGEFLVAERTLIQAFPRDREEKEWIVTQISCRLRQINETTPSKDIEDLAIIIQGLLEDENEREWEPLVSAGVSILGIMQHYGLKAPTRLLDLIKLRLPCCSISSQNLFLYHSLDRPTVTELRAAIRDLTEGNIHDDEGFGVSAIEGMLRRALATACEVGDPELFALAAGWLSQPALAAARVSREVTLKQPHADIASLADLLNEGKALKPQQMRDYAIALQRQVGQAKSNFIQLLDLPISAAKYVVAPDEALCFLAHDTENHLCRLVVRRDNIEGPSQLPKSQWDVERYFEWRKKFPRGYSWNRLFDYDIPPEIEIHHSLEALQPQIPASDKSVTILPESDLFGFTYFLTDSSTGWLGQTTRCATAPSLAWLATVRQLEKPRFELKAWLGHPTLADKGVLEPRSELEPIILQAGGSYLNTDSPRQIGPMGVSVILSHGSEGTFGSFAGVNDVGRFTNEDLARWLSQSACVILFVCNAGRNNGRMLNQETVGLVGQLLRRGVRAVIAPPAPLRNDLPSLWFAPFIDSLQRGDTVGEAHANASIVIRNKFSHPCAWGALQLFGDAKLAFTTGKPDK